MDTGNALTFKSGGISEGTVEYKEEGPATTATFNRTLESFAIVSKTDISGGGGDAVGRAVGIMLEWMHG